MESPERKDGVEVAALVRPVVGVGPGEVVGTGRDLTVGAIACRVVDIETRLIGQVYTTCGNKREA
jgi:hypothetical protein